MRNKDIYSSIACLCLTGCLLALVLTGCRTMSKVHTLTEEPGCVTSMEGIYCCKDWRGVKPALILEKTIDSKRYRDVGRTKTTYEVIEGQILSKDENGVTFAAKTDDSSSDSSSDAESYYPFDQIVALIDETGNAVYGAIPAKYSTAPTIELWLELSEYYYSDSKTHKVILEPNRPFAYCFPGGEYVVKAIYFSDNSGTVSKGIDYPELTIKLDPGYANYIGHIYITMEKTDIADSIYVTNRFKIPCKTLSSSETSGLGLFGGLVGGAVGGAVAGSIETASRLAGGASGDKQVFIGIDENYRPLCKSALKQNTIKIRK